MSSYNIKEHFVVEGVNWELAERKGRVELWYRRDTQQYQVMLYAHVRGQEPPLMSSAAAPREEANKIFDQVNQVIQAF